MRCLAGCRRAHALPTLVVLLTAALGALQPRYAIAEPTAAETEARRKQATSDYVALETQAKQRFLAGEREAAVRLMERAVAVLEANFPADHRYLALGASRLAELYKHVRRYEEALVRLRQSLSIFEIAMGPESGQVATQAHDIAEVLQTLGHYDAARPMYERAMRIREQVLPENHPALADTLTRLSETCRLLGDFEVALQVCDRALEMRQERFGRKHLNVSINLSNKGVLLQSMGRFEAAHACLKRALAIQEKSREEDPGQIALTLNNLAALLVDLGRFEEARGHQERALAILEEILGPDHEYVAITLNNLGITLSRLGQIDAAVALVERALLITQKTLGPAHPEVATHLNNLAYMLQDCGDPEAAVTYLERALDVMLASKGESHPDSAVVLVNLAYAQQTLGHLRRARTRYEQALPILTDAYGEADQRVAGCSNNLAQLHLDQGRHDAARPLFEAALRGLEASMGKTHPDVATVLMGLAALERQAGRTRAAREHMQRALDIVEQHVADQILGLQGTERLNLVRMLRHHLDEWLLLTAQLDESGYEAVWRFRGVADRAVAAERRFARRGGHEAGALIDTLRASGRMVSNLVNAVPPETDTAAVETWRKHYATAAAAQERAARALSDAYVKQGLDQAPEQAPLSRLEETLGEHEALVDYLRSGDRYIAWIVAPGKEPLRVELGDATRVEDAARAFVEATVGATGEGSRGPLRRLDPSSTAARDEAWKAAGAELRKLVFAPIEKSLSGQAHTLYLCPDAALAAIPFAALPGRDEGTYLIDDYLLSFCAQPQDLLPIAWSEGPAKGALLFGHVDYDDGVKRGKEHARRFGRLPQTRIEVETLTRLFGDDALCCMGADATEDELRYSSTGHRFLHLATHGFVREELMKGLIAKQNERPRLDRDMERHLAIGHDPLLLSGLALAGANRSRGEQDDGILTALEVSYFDLDGVELAVLSACQTALGEAESGEGVVGLVQGFRMAGAHRVVASLWEVDDEATRMLMEKMYAGLLRQEDPLSAPQALRDAARWLRTAKGADGRALAAPRYWSAFVCYGPAR